MSGQLVPQSDLTAEGLVLSACMLDENAFDAVAWFLRAEHFYADANRRIFEALVDLAGAGKPRDAGTVAGWLNDRRRLDQIGGTPYIAQLLAEMPVTAKLEATARRIVDKWRLRRIIDVARVMIAEAQTCSDDVSQFVQRCEAELFAVTQDAAHNITLQTAREIMRDCYEQTKSAHDARKPVGLSLGFTSLDDKINGLKAPNVYIVAARPGHGKTSFATQVARNVAVLGEPGRRGVFIASVEMSRKQIGDRFIAQESSLDTRLVESGALTPKQWAQYVSANGDIQRWPVIVDDAPGLTLPGLRSALRRAVRRFRQEYDTELALTIIDYVQLMRVVKGQERSENDRITELSVGITHIGKEFGVPILELSQLSRDPEKRPGKEPQQSDLRGSGSLEQDGHTIIFIHRADVYRSDISERDGKAKIIVAKCRGGRTGSVVTDYQDWCTRFIDAQDFDPNDAVAQQFHDFGDSQDTSEEWYNR